MDGPESRPAGVFNVGVTDARIPSLTLGSPIDESLAASSWSPSQPHDSIFQSSAVSTKDSSLPLNNDVGSQYATSYSPCLTSACRNKSSHLTSTPLQPSETKSFSSDTPSFSTMLSSFHTHLQMTFPICSSPLQSHSPDVHASTTLPTLNSSVSCPPRSVLWLVHRDPRDDGTGRCRLGPRALEALGVPRLGAPLRLTLERDRFAVCSAWPRWDRSDRHIQVDASCVGPHGKGLKLKSKVVLGVPSLAQRVAMLVYLTGSLPLDEDVSPTKLAELTPGYVPADLVAVCRSAASRAMLRRASVETSGRWTCERQQWYGGYPDRHRESDVRKSEGEGNRLKMERKEDHERVEEPVEVGSRGDVETVNVEFCEKNMKDNSVSVDNVVNMDVRDDEALNHGGGGFVVDGGEVVLGQVVDSTVDMGLGSREALGESDGRDWGFVRNEPGEKVTMEDFYRALHIVGPSVLRCGYAPRAIPLLTWDDIGGLQGVKLKLQQCIEWPLRNPAALRRLGVTPPRGVLLYGPPGCAKTSLAHAAANGFTVSFLSAGAADIFSPGFGDPEKTLVELFRRARASAPSLLFLDELDAMLCVRAGARGDGGAAARLLSTLLTEMDGVGHRLSDSKSRVLSPHSCAESGVECAMASVGLDDCENDRQMDVEKWGNQDNSAVLVLAATNRPELIDEALLRPGRLDRRIYVPPPDVQEREEILRRQVSACPLAADVCLPTIADLTPFYSGADLTAVCMEACLLAMQHEGMDSAMLHQEYLQQALHLVPPSLSADQLCSYEHFFQGRQ